MRHALIRILAAIAGLWLADQWLPRVQFDGAISLLVAAVLLSFVHALVRPVLVLLTLPITLLTLGLFLWLLNAALIGGVALLVPGFRVGGLLPALGAAALVSLVGAVANWLTRPDRDAEAR